MTLEDKYKFVNDLVGDVREAILKAVPKMPECWNGHELRQYIADKFGDEVWSQYAMRGNKLKAFRNEVAVRNL